jgi:hypothetical protein
MGYLYDEWYFIEVEEEYETALMGRSSSRRFDIRLDNTVALCQIPAFFFRAESRTGKTGSHKRG